MGVTGRSQLNSFPESTGKDILITGWRLIPGTLFSASTSALALKKDSAGPLPAHTGLVDHALVKDGDGAIDPGGFGEGCRLVEVI